jgi:hypothetical protein
MTNGNSEKFKTIYPEYECELMKGFNSFELRVFKNCQ